MPGPRYTEMKQREQAYEEVKHLNLENAVERDYLRDEINTQANFGEIIGESPALRRTLAQIEADFVSDAEVRAREKANIVAALRHANWRIWRPDGAAELLGVKPSTLTYRMKVFGISKGDR